MTACCEFSAVIAAPSVSRPDMKDIARQTQGILILRERGLMGGIIGIKETKP